jgi:murein DD-endopeptidase MepM/ murein hydrolase activator NlpD
MQDPASHLFSRLYSFKDEWAERAYELRTHHADDLALLTRLTAHLGIIALVIIGLLVSGIEIRAAEGPISYDQPQVDSGLPVISSLGQSGPGELTLAAVPITIERKSARRDVVQYAVKPGDNVSVIAARFGVSPDSVLWANAKLEDNPDLLSVGQVLFIPPVSGVLHTVGRGETVQAVAVRFKARPEDILSDTFNQANHDFTADQPILTVGAFLMVPNGEKPYVRKVYVSSGVAPKGAPVGTKNFMWPTSACISQGFWTRHPALDLATAKGVAVNAADSGYVELRGWDNSGYGNMILVNHGNGYITRYAHLSAFAVEPGQAVKRGQLIGRIGSTGRSTGPHLHFEIIQNGVHRNPVYFLSGRAPGNCYR